MRGSRRGFLTSAAAGAGGALLARPALAEGSAPVQWKLTSAFNPRLNLIFGGAESFVRSLSDITDQGFKITVAPPGEIASAVDALDAVAAGKADCAHTALSYSWTRDPAYIFGTGAPFGMNARQHTAWLQEGGGSDLINELLASRNL